MKTNITVKTILSAFSGLEKEHSLFDRKVRGVYFWQLLKFSLYMELIKLPYLADDAYEKLGSGIVAFFRKCFAGFIKSPFLCFNKKCDVLICPMDGGRNIKRNSGSYSMWTYPLEDELEQKGIPYLVLEVRDTLGRYSRKGKNIIYHERRNIFSLFDYLRVLFDRPKNKEINSALKGITDIAGKPVSELKTLSNNFITERIFKFRLQEAFYTRLLKKFKPKKVYFVSHFTWLAMIAACNKLKVETIELQHGSMLFEYPHDFGNSSIYAPDKLYLWGRYWYDFIAPLPISKNNIIFTGYKYLKDELNKYCDITAQNNRVLFLSSMREHLIDIAIKFSEMNPNFDVVFRLHPFETLYWKKRSEQYLELADAQKRLNNLDVEVANEVPLYHSLKSSRYTVAIFSTTCLESIAAGCKLILVSDNIVTLYPYLVDKVIVPLADNEKELSDIVNSNKNYWKNVDIDYFFAGSNGSIDTNETFYIDT